MSLDIRWKSHGLRDSKGRVLYTWSGNGNDYQEWPTLYAQDRRGQYNTQADGWSAGLQWGTTRRAHTNTGEYVQPDAVSQLASASTEVESPPATGSLCKWAHDIRPLLPQPVYGLDSRKEARDVADAQMEAFRDKVQVWHKSVYDANKVRSDVKQAEDDAVQALLTATMDMAAKFNKLAGSKIVLSAQWEGTAVVDMKALLTLLEKVA